MSFLSAFADFLTGPVGNGLQNTPKDIRNTKRNLSRSGFFNDETENDFITAEMEKSIRRFQRARDLKEDGKLLPGGETEREIFRTLERRDPDPFFGHAVDDGGYVGFGGNVSGTLERKPRHHDRPAFSSSALTGRKLDIGLLGSAGNDRLTDSSPVEFDATGRMIRDKTIPVPKRKPVVPELSSSLSQILKRIDNKKVMTEIIREEGDPKKYNYMFKDTAKGGGKVTVAGGVLLNSVEDAKELPFTVPDGRGGRRRATPEEIERAYRKVEAVQATNVPAARFNPKTEEFAQTHDLDDLRLPADIALREFEKRVVSSAKELRRKFPGFDDFPESAQHALLDMEFNMGSRFHEGGEDKPKELGRGWPELFKAVRKQDWIRVANQSSRLTEGHAGMADRNRRTMEKFLEAAKEAQKR